MGPDHSDPGGSALTLRVRVLPLQVRVLPLRVRVLPLRVRVLPLRVRVRAVAVRHRPGPGPRRAYLSIRPSIYPLIRVAAVTAAGGRATIPSNDQPCGGRAGTSNDTELEKLKKL